MPGRVTIPDHGTLSRYHIHRCRCDICRAHATVYAKRVALLSIQGQWQPLVDGEPVRRHVAMLAEFGIGATRAAHLAGVTRGCVERLLYGHNGYPPSRRMRTENARALLAVRPTLDNCAPGAKVDPTGTQRRVQALVARGYPIAHLAVRLGMQPTNLSKIIRAERVAAATALRVAALYDRLWDADPAAGGVSKHGYAYALRTARSHAWVPPGAWDDDTIGDPGARPDLGDAGRRQDALIEDTAFITETTGLADLTAIAKRLGVSRNYLEKAHERHRAKLAQAA